MPRLEYAIGVVQLTQDPPSSLHSKLEPVSLALKVKLAAVEVVLDSGPLRIVVSGGVVSPGGGVEASSTVQVSVAGVSSTFPAASSARTENWCEPRLRPV